MKNYLKTISKIMIIASIILLVFQMSVNAKAVTPKQISGSDPVHSVKVTRNVKNVTNPVTNTFTYSIEEDPSNPAKVQGAPTSFTIQFDGVQPDGKNIAKKEADLDFTGTTFTKVGDYKFIISETSSSDETTYAVSTDKYYIYVQVVNQVDAQGVPTGELTVTLLNQGTLTNDTAVKRNITFPAETSFTHLVLKKNVTGNMGDVDEYFKFKVDITDAAVGDNYVILGQDEEVEYNGAKVNTSSNYVAGEENYVYLKDGQTITIGLTSDEEGLDQIKLGANYVITEQEADDYQTYIDRKTRVSDTKEVTKIANEDAGSNITTFENHKEAESITGMALNVTPYIAIGVLAIILLVVFIKFTNKNKKINY